MRYFTRLFAIGAALLSLVPAPVQAQQTYTQPVNFQMSNQSMWSPSLGTAGYSYNLPLSTSWNYHGGDSSYRHVPILGKFGAGASVDSEGSAGLKLNAYATSGSVDVNYPLTLTLTYPDPATLTPGQTFTISSSWSPTGGRLSTHSPDAGVKLNALMQVNPMKINVKVEAFSHNIINNDLVNGAVNIDHQLFDTHSLLQGSYDLIPNILSVNYHLPVVTTSGSGTSSITSSGEDAFLTVDGDFSNAVAKLLNIASFSGGIRKGYKSANGFVDYAFLDLVGQIPVSLAQNFQFTPTPMVTLNLSSGAPVTFSAGQSVQLTMPSDGSPLTITPSVTLNNQFTNRTHIKIGGLLTFTVADITAGVHVSVIGTKKIQFEPVDPFTLVGGNLLDVDVYNQAFTLGGFSPQSLPAFTLASAVTTPLVAQDDFYSATSSDGVHYAVDVSTPGILANDSGPSGFHALDFVGVTQDGLFAITLDTNGHFNFQGVKGAAGQYMIPYQITDGHGHYATANIYVNIGG